VQFVTLVDIADFASLGAVFSVSIGKPSHVKYFYFYAGGKSSLQCGPESPGARGMTALK